MDYPVKANFCATQARQVESLFTEDTFFDSLPATKNAVAAIQAITNSGEDVWIIIATTAGEKKVIEGQMKWVESKFSPFWGERVIVCRDKTLLLGDILIDPQPFPEKETIRLFTPKKQETSNPTSRKPTWEHVVFDRPCNIAQTEKRRLIEWKQWKSILFPEENVNIDYPYFIHGSKDSLDEDRLYLFPSMPDNKTIRQFLSGVSEDRNIFVVEDGHVVQCHKGFSDEVQNALLSTYSFHKQVYDLPISEKVPRLVISKVFGTILGILIRISLSHYKREIKSALRSGNLGHRKRVLQNLDFSTILDHRVDDYKYIAFQFVQAISLIDGNELYSKKEVSENYPVLHPFMYRDAEHVMKNLHVHIFFFRNTFCDF
eukprot:TRINITY_DN1731_c0_g2_i13.p1 TRINITY_DN1731_c0_g2~~TRINITY_DN1731_c0_g2_i13.p1  ORF type:complete len:432 (-),score=73.30 TRINITY_DN1731_c0_g2_i13:662-1780(-)